MTRKITTVGQVFRKLEKQDANQQRKARKAQKVGSMGQSNPKEVDWINHSNQSAAFAQELSVTDGRHKLEVEYV
jgi:hypothetical protein